MGRVYNEYCYDIGQTAVDSFNANPSRFNSASNAITEVHAHSDFGLYLHTYPLTNTNRTEQFSTEYLAECLTPGPLNSIVYGIDWTVVEWIFGAGLVMFATGAAVGSVINIVRKARI